MVITSEWENMGFDELLRAARSLSRKNFNNSIHFYAPGFLYYVNRYYHSSPKTFPSISITGNRCSLNCDHCGGKLLSSMIPAPTPEKLYQVCRKIYEDGGIGCLISGGCLPDGSVPLGRFVEVIGRVKRELGLKLVVHTGLIDEATAHGLREAGVDAALIDVIGSDETIRDVYHLKAGVRDYEKALHALHTSGLPLIPHVVVGLHYGEVKGELQALKMISKYDPSALVIVALRTIQGTPMEGISPPPPEEIGRIIAIARLLLPKVPIVLGCARPLGRHRVVTDALALKAGVNAIAFPAEKTIELAKAMGLKITFSPLCCSQIYEDISGSALSH